MTTDANGKSVCKDFERYVVSAASRSRHDQKAMETTTNNREEKQPKRNDRNDLIYGLALFLGAAVVLFLLVSSQGFPTGN